MKNISRGSIGFLTGASLISTEGCSRSKKHQKTPPNIILILADDMGYSDLGCYGGEILTPNLDKLAQNGLRYTNFHNTSRCCPTRASLLTGLYPHQAGVGHMMNDWGLDGYRGDLNDSCMTIAEVLQSAGYSTYMCGKWHVTRFLETDGSKHNWPLQRGFDRHFGTITGAGSYFEPDTLTLDNDRMEIPSDNFYYTDAISDNAVRLIREHDTTSRGGPFFLYVAYTAPHWPLHAREEDIARYRGRFDKGWDTLRKDRYDRMIELGIIDPRWKLTERDPRVPPWETTGDKDWQLRRMEVYAAQVDVMDRGIGRIVRELEKIDRLENSLIIFLSDNGGCDEEIDDSWLEYLLHGGEYVCRGKTSDGKLIRIGNDPAILPGPYDTYQSYGIPWANLSNSPFRLYKSRAHQGGIATPLILHWPARIKQKGELRDQLGHVIDIMATCVDVAGADYPKERYGIPTTPLEGRSLTDTFENHLSIRNPIYFEHERRRGVIEGDWKLVDSGEHSHWELYNMKDDRTEINDLADQKPEKVQQIAKKWRDWAERAKVIPWEKRRD